MEEEADVFQIKHVFRLPEMRLHSPLAGTLRMRHNTDRGSASRTGR